MPSLVIVTVVKDDYVGLEQTCRTFEIQTKEANHLFIDGASTDGSAALASQWATILGGECFSAVDSGPYWAMNSALNLIDSDSRVWFVNAGDRLPHAQVVERVHSLISSRDFTWGYGPFHISEMSGKLRETVDVAPFSLRNVAYGKSPVCHQTVIASARILKDLGGFDTKYAIAADYKLNLLLAKSFVPTIWEEPIVIFRAGGISDRTLRKNIREQREIRHELFDFRGWLRITDIIFDAVRYLRLGVRSGMTPLFRSS